MKARYVLVWLTELPPSDATGRYRGGISDIKVTG